MSLDKSLRKKGALARARNVLKRNERIEKLKELERWDEERGPFALPKGRVFRIVAKKTKKKAKEEGAEGAAPAAGKAGAKPAAAKPAAAAAGDKKAAPKK